MSESLAIHEAGHAVAAYAVGMVVDRVYLDESEGRVKVRFLPGDDRNPEIRRLIVFAAGLVAEALAGYDPPYALSRVDLGEICCYARRLVGEEDSPILVRHVTDCTVDLLRRHWDSVERVAEELLERESLGADEVLALLAEPGEAGEAA